jgi:hypothetical protein
MSTRHSLKLQPDDWRRLAELAADTNCFYRQNPSWRRLILRIARGEITLKEKRRREPISWNDDISDRGRRSNETRQVKKPQRKSLPPAGPLNYNYEKCPVEGSQESKKVPDNS